MMSELAQLALAVAIVALSVAGFAASLYERRTADTMMWLAVAVIFAGLAAFLITNFRNH